MRRLLLILLTAALFAAKVRCFELAFDSADQQPPSPPSTTLIDFPLLPFHSTSLSNAVLQRHFAKAHACDGRCVLCDTAFADGQNVFVAHVDARTADAAHRVHFMCFFRRQMARCAVCDAPLTTRFVFWRATIAAFWDVSLLCEYAAFFVMQDADWLSALAEFANVLRADAWDDRNAFHALFNVAVERMEQREALFAAALEITAKLGLKTLCERYVQRLAADRPLAVAVLHRAALELLPCGAWMRRLHGLLVARDSACDCVRLGSASGTALHLPPKNGDRFKSELCPNAPAQLDYAHEANESIRLNDSVQLSNTNQLSNTVQLSNTNQLRITVQLNNTVQANSTVQTNSTFQTNSTVQTNSTLPKQENDTADSNNENRLGNATDDAPNDATHTSTPWCTATVYVLLADGRLDDAEAVARRCLGPDALRSTFFLTNALAAAGGVAVVERIVGACHALIWHTNERYFRRFVCEVVERAPRLFGRIAWSLFLFAPHVPTLAASLSRAPDDAVLREIVALLDGEPHKQSRLFVLLHAAFAENATYALLVQRASPLTLRLLVGDAAHLQLGDLVAAAVAAMRDAEFLRGFFAEVFWTHTPAVQWAVVQAVVRHHDEELVVDCIVALVAALSSAISADRSAALEALFERAAALLGAAPGVWAAVLAAVPQHADTRLKERLVGLQHADPQFAPLQTLFLLNAIRDAHLNSALFADAGSALFSLLDKIEPSFYAVLQTAATAAGCELFASALRLKSVQ